MNSKTKLFQLFSPLGALLMLLFVGSIYSCDKTFIDSTTPKAIGNVEFGMQSTSFLTPSSSKIVEGNSSKEKKVNSIEENAEKIVISIVKINPDGSSEPTYTNETIQLIKINNDILSIPLSFDEGTYHVTLFEVLDSNDNIIAMTPAAGSELAGFIDNPLNVEFIVKGNETEKVILEVVGTEFSNASDFGYRSFSFVEVSTEHYLVSVSAYDEDTSNFELTDSQIIVIFRNRIISSNSFVASTTALPLPSDNNNEEVTLVVNKRGYEGETVVKTIGELKQTTIPKEEGGLGPVVILLINDGINVPDIDSIINGTDDDENNGDTTETNSGNSDTTTNPTDTGETGTTTNTANGGTTDTTTDTTATEETGNTGETGSTGTTDNTLYGDINGDGIIEDGEILYTWYMDGLRNGRENLNWIEKFNEGAPYREWTGVNELDGRVDGLNLMSLDLSGQFIPLLGQLSVLREFVVINNPLGGFIPEEFGDLSNLIKLNLINLSIVGDIPNTLGKLTNLKELQINQTFIVGSIPVEFGNLFSLERLSLSDNQITGSIPKELGSCVRLDFLWLYNNFLSGTVPSELNNLQILNSLNLTNNSQLTGVLPNNLCNVFDLKISGTNLTCTN